MSVKKTYLLSTKENEFLRNQIEKFQKIHDGISINNFKLSNYESRLQTSIDNTIGKLNEKTDTIFDELDLLHRYIILRREVENNQYIIDVDLNNYEQTSKFISYWYPKNKLQIISSVLNGHNKNPVVPPINPKDVLDTFIDYLDNLHIQNNDVGIDFIKGTDSNVGPELIIEELSSYVKDVKKDLNQIDFLANAQYDDVNLVWSYFPIWKEIKEDYLWITGQFGRNKKLPYFSINLDDITNKKLITIGKINKIDIEVRYNIALDILFSAEQLGFFDSSFEKVDKIVRVNNLIDWVYKELRGWKILVVRNADGTIDIVEQMNDDDKDSEILSKLFGDEKLPTANYEILFSISDEWEKSIEKINRYNGVGPWIKYTVKILRERGILVPNKKKLEMTEKGRKLLSFLKSNFITTSQYQFINIVKCQTQK